MASSTSNSSWRKGFRDGLPFVVMIVPFGMVFGVIGTEAGLNIAEIMGFSVLVIAGSAQLAALQLMADNTPTLIILITSLAINLRMAMYSASLTPHFGPATFWQRVLAAYVLVDQSYALAMDRFDRNPEMSTSDKLSYYFGVAAPVVTLWYASTLSGAMLGEAIPADLQLDFIVPLMFLSMVAPALKTLAHVAAALTSVCLSLVFAFLPYGSGLLVAALVALVVGSQVELWTQKRAQT
jgi:branched chain amino acid efflux pump